MGNLLVIGGSGFFGKSILDAYSRGLLEPWGIDSVTVIARDADSLSHTHPYLIGKSVVLLNQDITKCDSLPRADYVIHAAASSDAERYLLRPLQERANVQLAVTNYALLAEKFHSNSKLVFASSGAVYGQQPDSVSALDERVPLGKLESLDFGKRDYAAAKRDGEEIIRDLGRSGLKVSIARCFAFVGPYLPLHKHFAIGNFLADGMAQRPIEMRAQHAVYRSYLYADELVIWLMTIAHHANSDAPTYNVGSNMGIILGELASKVAKYFNVPALVPPITGGKVDKYVPSILKVKQELGLEVQIGIDQAISLTVNRIKELKTIKTP
jgi:dTDP-glucose 4,6-dehydratase